MLAVRLPQELEKRLNKIAEETNRPKSYYVRRAIESFLEEYEDYLIAISRLEKKGPTLTQEQMERELALKD